MRLSKHHGLGNDFLVALQQRQDERALVVGDGPALARRLCDRSTGIGADGLILATSPEGPHEGADVVMNLFNADGSRAELSGNGIRCLAQALSRARGGVESVVIDTDVGRRVLRLSAEDDPHTVHVEVPMGRVGPGPALDGETRERLDGRRFAAVDVGNPHLVIEHDRADGDLDAFDVVDEGRWFEARVPGGINVEFISAHEDGSLSLRVWERGAGLTRACGTGATAAASVAHGWGLVGDDVTVVMPGGAARVQIGANGELTLIGPSSYIGEIEVPDV